MLSTGSLPALAISEARRLPSSTYPPNKANLSKTQGADLAENPPIHAYSSELTSDKARLSESDKVLSLRDMGEISLVVRLASKVKEHSLKRAHSTI